MNALEHVASQFIKTVRSRIFQVAAVLAWLYAIVRYGWFLGLGLGWAPAIGIGALVAFLVPALWGLFAPAGGHEDDTPVIGSTASLIYHRRECEAALKIGPKNRVQFASSWEAALHGFRPCELCEPPSTYRHADR